MKTVIIGKAMLSALALMAASTNAGSQTTPPGWDSFEYRADSIFQTRQAIENHGGNFASKSEKRAAAWSAGATFFPIISGMVLWRIQKPKTVTSSYGWQHEMGPDRTLPVSLIVSGIIVGPSAGYIYGGCPNRGMTGLFIRMGVAGATSLAISSVGRSGSDTFLDFSGLVAAITVGAVGGGIVIIDSIYDLSRVKGTIRERNEKLRGYSVAVGPRLFDNARVPGLELAIRF